MERFTAWWSREYFGAASGGASTARAAEAAYKKDFAAIDTPDKLWLASDAIEQLLDRLYFKAAGETYAAFPADTLAQFQLRDRQLDDALAAAAQAQNEMSLSQQRFFSIDVAPGLETASRPTKAALKLEEALRAPDAGRMWQLKMGTLPVYFPWPVLVHQL